MNRRVPLERKGGVHERRRAAPKGEFRSAQRGGCLMSAALNRFKQANLPTGGREDTQCRAWGHT